MDISIFMIRIRKEKPFSFRKGWGINCILKGLLLQLQIIKQIITFNDWNNNKNQEMPLKHYYF